MSDGPVRMANVLDLIGVTEDYLRGKAGPPKFSQPGSRTYLIEGCAVSIGTTDGSISWVSFIPDGCPTARQVFPDMRTWTVGEFTQKFGEGRVYAECLTLCGNSHDPLMYVLVPGVHVNGFTDYVVNTYEWSEEVERLLTAGLTEDEVIARRFNCLEVEQAPVLQALAAAPISSITVGHNINLAQERECRNPATETR